MANNWVTIDDLVRIEIKFSDRCEVTHFFFFWVGVGGGGGGGGGGWQLPQGIVGLCIMYACVFFGL